MQAGAAGISTEFPRPSRHTRRARASRLAPLPATSAAHDPHKASATLPPLDPPDIVSRHMDDAAAHSGACSGHDNGPAISASTEAKACSCNGLEDPRADPQADPGADAELMVQQPREGTPVSSNRRHYRVSPKSPSLCSCRHRKLWPACQWGTTTCDGETCNGCTSMLCRIQNLKGGKSLGLSLLVPVMCDFCLSAQPCMVTSQRLCDVLL